MLEERSIGSARACRSLPPFSPSREKVPEGRMRGGAGRRIGFSQRKQVLEEASSPPHPALRAPSPGRRPLRNSVRARFDVFGQQALPVVPGRSASQDARRGRESNMESNKLKPYWITSLGSRSPGMTIVPGARDPGNSDLVRIIQRSPSREKVPEGQMRGRADRRILIQPQNQFFAEASRPLIRPFGPPSPARGEGEHAFRAGGLGALRV